MMVLGEGLGSRSGKGIVGSTGYHTHKVAIMDLDSPLTQ